jgi:hypothetical protein
MNIAVIFAVFCGVFVAAVLGLVMWLIIVGLRHRKFRSEGCVAKEIDKAWRNGAGAVYRSFLPEGRITTPIRS